MNFPSIHELYDVMRPTILPAKHVPIHVYLRSARGEQTSPTHPAHGFRITKAEGTASGTLLAFLSALQSHSHRNSCIRKRKWMSVWSFIGYFVHSSTQSEGKDVCFSSIYPRNQDQRTLHLLPQGTGIHSFTVPSSWGECSANFCTCSHSHSNKLHST